MATQFALRIGGRFYLMTAKEAAPVMDALATARCVDDAWVSLDLDNPEAESVRIWHDSQPEDFELRPFPHDLAGVWPLAKYEAHRDEVNARWKAERDAKKAAAEAEKEASEG